VAFIHHVNLGVSTGKVEAEAEWLTEVLGCTEIEGPPNAHWFVFDDGAQIHLSEDEFHRPAGRMHVAVQFEDVAKIRTAERNGLRYVFCADPSGNKWELRSPLTDETAGKASV
jgi:catechol 2,3-dioxygenase-like lactoylglutathione lyase family enzyme